MNENKKRMPPPLETNLVQDNLPIRIEHNLYIGSKFSGYNLDALKETGITHILNASSNPSSFPAVFVYLSLNIRDSDDANILSCIPASNIFIKAGIEAGGVLVHCQFGRSRSSALVAAFLMQYQNLTYDQSIEKIRKYRSSVIPNAGFEEQLRTYEIMNYDSYLAQKAPNLIGILNPAKHRPSRRRSSDSDKSSVCSYVSSACVSPLSLGNGSDEGNVFFSHAHDKGHVEDTDAMDISSMNLMEDASNDFPVFLPNWSRERERERPLKLPSKCHRRISSASSTSSLVGSDHPLPLAPEHLSMDSSSAKVLFVLKNDRDKDTEVLRLLSMISIGSPLILPPSPPVSPMHMAHSSGTSVIHKELKPRHRPVVIHATGTDSSCNSNALPDIILSIEDDDEPTHSNFKLASLQSKTATAAEAEHLFGGRQSSHNSINSARSPRPPSLKLEPIKSNSFAGNSNPSIASAISYKKSSSMSEIWGQDNWGSDLGYDPDDLEASTVGSDLSDSSISNSNLISNRNGNNSDELKIQAFFA